LKKKVSIKECRYIKSAVEFEYTYIFDFCRSVAYLYQIEKQRLCKSINDRFLIKTEEITSKATKTSNSQLSVRFNNLTFDCWQQVWRLQRFNIVRHNKLWSRIIPQDSWYTFSYRHFVAVMKDVQKRTYKFCKFLKKFKYRLDTIKKCLLPIRSSFQ
jgi:hypothetical protein